LQEFEKSVDFYTNEPNRLLEELWFCGLPPWKADRIVRKFFEEIQPGIVVELRPLETARSGGVAGRRVREGPDSWDSNWQKRMRGIKLMDEILGRRDENSFRREDHAVKVELDKILATKLVSETMKNYLEIRRLEAREGGEQKSGREGPGQSH
jgi:hypothetical protein